MFLSLLTILFVGLKLTGFIDWSWFFVVAPTLIHILVVVLFFVAAAAIGVNVRKIR